MNNIDLLINYTGLPLFWVKLLLSFFFSFIITYYSIPAIIKISRRKNLMDEPGLRSSHLRKIPNLGGIAIFASIGFCAPIFAYELFEIYKFLFASLVILLYIGVMDDVVVVRAYKKLIAQFIVTILMVLGSDVRIGNLFGLFGVYEINYFFSVIISIFIFIILINAFNLIDGIDGLSGGFAVISSLIFGLSYFRLGEYNYPLVILCTIIIGSILAFLYYNLSNYRNFKIFMGDTGSLIIGFLLAFTAITFINLFVDKANPSIPKYHLQTAPVIAIAILILPVIDTLNVIIVRLLTKKSPFDADMNHIHHKLLKLDLTHRRSSFYIIVYYIFVVGIAYYLRHLNVNLLFLIIMIIGFIGCYLPDIFLKLKKSDI